MTWGTANIKDGRAWVVFMPDAEMRILRLLRRGFRHCFVIWQAEDGIWHSFDALACGFEFTVHTNLPANFDIPAWLKGRTPGVTIVAVKVSPRPEPATASPLGLLTCVGVTKRLLGIRAFGIYTPYRLYRYLHKQAQHDQKTA